MHESDFFIEYLSRVEESPTVCVPINIPNADQVTGTVIKDHINQFYAIVAIIYDRIGNEVLRLADIESWRTVESPQGLWDFLRKEIAIPLILRRQPQIFSRNTTFIIQPELTD
jgi:hypothetical protein